MIQFTFTDTYTESRAAVQATMTSYADDIGTVVEDFKNFLRHAGYHGDNVDAITYDDSVERQGLPVQDGTAPRQLDLFDDRVGG